MDVKSIYIFDWIGHIHRPKSMMWLTLMHFSIYVSGLGICLLAEFGRVLLYNLLIDEENSRDGEPDEEHIMHGYKQMILVLQSQSVETGKSFFCELMSRIFHGKKKNIHSILSFDSAKSLLSMGDPVIIGKSYPVDLLIKQFFQMTLLTITSDRYYSPGLLNLSGLSQP